MSYDLPIIFLVTGNSEGVTQIEEISLVAPFLLYSEAPPQTGEFVCIYQIYCLKHRDAGCWMLDAG